MSASSEPTNELTVTIYGASDDLIEVGGALHAEFGAWNETEDGGSALAFSDGTVLSIVYAPGEEAFWRINRLRTGSATYEKHEASDETEDYSDRVTLTGNLTWMLRGAVKDFIKCAGAPSTGRTEAGE